MRLNENTLCSCFVEEGGGGGRGGQREMGVGEGRCRQTGRQTGKQVGRQTECEREREGRGGGGGGEDGEVGDTLLHIWDIYERLLSNVHPSLRLCTGPLSFAFFFFQLCVRARMPDCSRVCVLKRNGRLSCSEPWTAVPTVVVIIQCFPRFYPHVLRSA